jgi:hypothetical protein
LGSLIGSVTLPTSTDTGSRVERNEHVRADNTVHGPVYGDVVQADAIDNLHLHQTTTPVHIVRPTAADPRPGFGVGSVVRVGDRNYLVQDQQVGEEYSPDGAFVYRQARVAVLNGTELGWFRQIENRQAGPGAGNILAAELAVAKQVGFPPILQFESATSTTLSTTLVTAWPREPSGRACDSLDRRLDGTPVLGGRLRGICTGLLGVCAALERLHALGHAHRALCPRAAIVRDDADWQLRDLGLAAQPARPDEHPGDFQAPEQRRRGARPPGPWTDVHQMAAILHVTLTGRHPHPGAPLPVRAWRADAPAGLAAAVDAGVAPDPARRPDMGTFAGLVRQASRHIR